MPAEFKYVVIMIIIGIVCLYLYMLDKKGEKMQETPEGKQAYYEKYTPKWRKKKNTIKTSTIGKPNSRERISKKERRKSKREDGNN